MGTKSTQDTAIIEPHDNQKKRYEDLYKHYKNSHRSLNWVSRYSQIIRFLQFLKIGDLNGKKILDLGCGLGDFLGFLVAQGIHCEYSGYDIVPNFIKECQETYPDARFEERDILSSQSDETFDYIFCSGVFAHGSRKFFEDMVKMAYQMCEIGFAFNIFKAHQDSKEFFNISEEEVTFYCRNLKPDHGTILKDYIPDDFTIFLYK